MCGSMWISVLNLSHLPMFSLHALVLGAVWKPEGHLVPTGQHRILLQSGQNWSGTPHSCVWSRLDDGSDDTVISVGGFFFLFSLFQGCSPPVQAEPTQRRISSGKGRQKPTFREGLHVHPVIFFQLILLLLVICRVFRDRLMDTTSLDKFWLLLNERSQKRLTLWNCYLNSFSTVSTTYFTIVISMKEGVRGGGALLAKEQFHCDWWSL